MSWTTSNDHLSHNNLTWWIKTWALFKLSARLDSSNSFRNIWSQGHWLEILVVSTKFLPRLPVQLSKIYTNNYSYEAIVDGEKGAKYTLFNKAIDDGYVTLLGKSWPQEQNDVTDMTSITASCGWRPFGCQEEALYLFKGWKLGYLRCRLLKASLVLSLVFFCHALFHWLHLEACNPSNTRSSIFFEYWQQKRLCDFALLSETFRRSRRRKRAELASGRAEKFVWNFSSVF